MFLFLLLLLLSVSLCFVSSDIAVSLVIPRSVTDYVSTFLVCYLVLGLKKCFKSYTPHSLIPSCSKFEIVIYFLRSVREEDRWPNLDISEKAKRVSSSLLWFLELTIGVKIQCDTFRKSFWETTNTLQEVLNQCWAKIDTMFPFRSQGVCRKLACVPVCFPARQMKRKRKLDALTENVWLSVASFTSQSLPRTYWRDGPSCGFGQLENPILLR